MMSSSFSRPGPWWGPLSSLQASKQASFASLKQKRLDLCNPSNRTVRITSSQHGFQTRLIPPRLRGSTCPPISTVYGATGAGKFSTSRLAYDLFDFFFVYFYFRHVRQRQPTS